MNKKPPAYQHYPTDYMGDEHVQQMNLAQEGAFLRLRDHQWLNGYIPVALVALAKICRVQPSKMARLWPGIAPLYSPAGDGRLIYQPLEDQRSRLLAFRQERSETGRRGATVRHGSAMAQPLNKDGSATAQPKHSVSSLQTSPSTDSPPTARAGEDEPPPTPGTPAEARAKALARVGAPGEAELIRRELHTELAAASAATGRPPDVLLAQCSRTGRGDVITNPESCTSVPWMRITVDKLRGERLKAAADAAGTAGDQRRNASIAAGVAGGLKGDGTFGGRRG